MKAKIIIGITIVSLILFTTATQGLAGARQHYRWEGAAIVLGGLAALGIVSSLIAPPPPYPAVIYPPRAYYYPAPPEYYPPQPPARWVPGHWRIERTWEPETWRRVWVPSHHDRNGSWIQGHWEQIREGGRWVETRAWVPGYYQ
jgi:hypothetical protein